ncbi:MAG: AMP-binding protein [Salibacteraceae bacterium]
MKAAHRYTQRIALVEQGRKVRYHELAEGVVQTATYFRQKGIRPGDRVLVFVPMSIDLYRTVLALFYLGASAVFLDEWVNKSRMEQCCRQAQCQAFIGIWKARVFAWFSAPLRQIPIRLGPKYPVKKQDRIEMYAARESDTALITFTTGSTGQPKAANRTHGFLKAQYDALIDKIQPHPEDVDMPVLPIVLLCNLGTGGTSLIADFKASKPQTLAPQRILQQMEQTPVNRITASPFFVLRLAEHLLANQQSMPHLEKVFTGGAPVFPAEAARLQKAFPNARIEVVYGSTEAEPISAVEAGPLANSRQEMLQSGLLVGRPYHQTEVKIVRMHAGPLRLEEHGWDKLECSVGEPGEIVVAGAHVLEHYFNSPGAMEQSKIDEYGKFWHRTGDAGRFSEDGYLYLLGRCSQMIPHQDNYQAPFLFENFLKEIEGVVAGTILEWNQQRSLVFEAENKELTSELKAQLKRDLPEVECIIEVDKMPLDPRHFS